MRAAGIYALIIAISSLAVSCTKSSLSSSEQLDKEQALLKQYLQTNNITTTPTASGLYYIPSDTGTGIKPDTLDVVEFTYTLKRLNGTVIATNIASVATQNGFNTSGVFYVPFKYRLAWWFAGLKEGFQLMREGGKATFIIPSQLAYGPNGASGLNIAGYTTVIFEISLIRVIHDPIAYENSQIQTFLADSISQAKTVEHLDSGVLHITDIAGSGVFPADYQTVSVRYVAKFIDGTFIESNTGNLSPFNYRVAMDQVIQGFYIGIKHMKKGESGWVIIPYKQAYGERPPYYINLPPFTTMLYYITIVDIQ